MDSVGGGVGGRAWGRRGGGSWLCRASDAAGLEDDDGNTTPATCVAFNGKHARRGYVTQLKVFQPSTSKLETTTLGDPIS
jgi:hypothetical protein